LRKKNEDMKTTDARYAAFARLLEDGTLLLDKKVTFGRLCRMAGAPRIALGRLLRRELGCSGPALLAAYRRTTVRLLED
jgi:hypothetical protein